MWLPLLIGALTGYLLGNLNGAVCVSTLKAKDDVRTHGSGNAGLTNFIRNYGSGYAILVIAIDGIKTALACLLCGLLLAPYGLETEGRMLGGVAVTLGHNFPATLGFRGGKGIMCGGVIALCVDWRLFLAIMAVFALLTLASRYVSLGSIAASACFAVGFAGIYFYRGQPWVAVGGIFLGALAVFMHRKNIVRLINGTESKINLKRKAS